ncbi:MAG: hypothetical protein DRI36_02725 [Caldiserica bacterium]|nr:MAG: hypothetical protein DRI36_02725 [Caldisericota bacterium]
MNIKLRFYGYLAGLKMSKKNPVIGTGPDSYLWRFRRYVPEEFVKEGRVLAHAGYAHNQFLQYLIDTGIIGLGAYVYLFLFFILKGVKFYPGISAGLFSIFISGFFSFFPLISWFFIFLFFSIINKKDEKVYFKLVHLLFSIPIFIIFLSFYIADIKFKEGVILKDERKLKKAVRMNPFIDFYRLTLGKILVENGKYEEAEEVFRKLLKRNPNNALAWNGFGFALRKSGKYMEAIECFKKAIEVDPHLVQGYINLALTYEKIKDFENAIKFYKKAIGLKKEEIALFNLGVIYGNMGDYENAKYYWEILYKINPDYPKLKNYLQIVNNLLKSKIK